MMSKIQIQTAPVAIMVTIGLRPFGGLTFGGGHGLLEGTRC